MQRAAPQTFDRVLSSMCTQPHPAARKAAERFLATNPGDPSTYQTVAALEKDALDYLADITGLPTPHGYITSGGTEANIQAVRAARNYLGRDDPNVVAPESIHFSFQKAADVLGVELRIVPIDDEFRADTEAVRAAVDENTIVVAGVAGTTEFGRVDPIPKLADIAHDAGALMHVDAAWGGFILPFTDHEWSFAHAPIDSMTIDPHKYGQAVVPAGGLLFREREVVDALAIDTPYLESASQASLTGTRSGAGVASAVAAMRELWPNGYRDVYETQQANADWLYAELVARGYDAVEPELPLVAADLPESEFESLRDLGWRISRTASGELRIVCMPHVSRESLRAFLSDLDSLRPVRN